MSIPVALAISVLLLALNAFFVAAEFALVASRPHRLEQQASTGGRAARAAVVASRELSIMLAGTQFGITLATLGLGALAKPAVAAVLDPLLTALRLPVGLSHVAAIVLAVLLVVFLHMVIGEMTPKSWAIAHPERSALLLALPFRAFSWIFHPGLVVLNGCADLLLRLAGVTAKNTLAETHAPAALQLLLAQSHEHGVLPDEEHQLLSGVLQLERETLRALMLPLDQVVSIEATASSMEVERLSRASGRSRLVVISDGRPQGLVHVRDAVQHHARQTPCLVQDLTQDAIALAPDLPLIDAIGRMREQRAQLALVTEQGIVVGIAALEDLLEKVLGQFEDETDATRRG